MTITITSFNFFNSPVKLWRDFKPHNFKIKRAQEARHNQFFFQNVQNNETFEILKMFKNNRIELRFTTQKGSSCSPWTACSVFDWKYLFFWVNLVQKLKITSSSWNFVPRLHQLCRIPWWCSLLLFRLEIKFWANLFQKIKIASLSWSFTLD